MDKSCHCEDHSGVDVRLDSHETKLSSNCNSTISAHQRIDGCVEKTTFQWAFGILITVFILTVGYQFKTLSSIDKGVAVLTEKVNKIEQKVK